jgi:hypothetical protein
VKRAALHIFLLAAMLAIALPARAQSGFIQVSGTVVDPQGFPYAGGSTGGATISAVLVPSGISSATLNGNSFATSIGPAALSNTGQFTLTLADNTLVSPAGTQWQFTVIGTSGLPWPIGRGSQGFTVTLTIHGNGSTQDISSNLQSAALSLTNVCANSNLGSFACGPGGGTPGSPVNSYQYNCAGSFCGGALLNDTSAGTWARINGALSGFIRIGKNNVSVPELEIGDETTGNVDASLMGSSLLLEDGNGNYCELTDTTPILSVSCSDGTLTSDYSNRRIELPLIAAPSLPASGQANVWVDSTANQLECELSTGASCLPTAPASGNCASAGGTCASAGTGSVTVAASQTTVVVDTTAVTANSVIILTFDSSLGAKLGVTCNATEPALYGVSARSAGVSFTITSTSPSVNPACFSYAIFG